MFTDAMTNIARERASFLRDAEYIKENVNDSELQESILIYENGGDNGICLESDITSPEEKKELKEAIEQIPNDTTDTQKEIDRIVLSDKDSLTLDEVMGITQEPATDAEQLLDAVAELTTDTDTDA